MDDAERIAELEIKAAFQERAIADLHDALVAHHKRVEDLEARVHTLEEALKRSVRAPEGHDVVLGGMDGDDPVPKSG